MSTQQVEHCVGCGLAFHDDVQPSSGACPNCGRGLPEEAASPSVAEVTELVGAARAAGVELRQSPLAFTRRRRQVRDYLEAALVPFQAVKP